ncbi:hypothetical protein QUF76_03640 [Desulfobacterales bacterium HSG16]|nr:hypothetical protein [Desulfobacterales bacterium HSG16]
MISPDNFTDPFEIGSIFAKTGASWIQNPESLARMLDQLSGRIQKTLSDNLEPFFSKSLSADKIPEYDEAALLDAVKTVSASARKLHLIYNRWMKEFIDNTPDLKPDEKERCAFWISQLIYSMAPSNYFWTNPAAVKKSIDTKGKSLAQGIETWIEDLKRGDGLLKLSDENAFSVGKNIAQTKGAVVFRNELMELIQYEPVKKKTWAVPVVFIQPWINKFYIFDLSEQNSFVRYLLNQGFSVFITSWKNPGHDMRNTTFEDYMFKGALTAVEVANQICNTKKVHAAGYCVGACALAALMAWLNRKYEDQDKIPVARWTTFAGLTDFSRQGDLSFFISEKSLPLIEASISVNGYLDKTSISLIFRLLQPNNLIWRYFVNNYLYGTPPPKSDFLFWNADSTRLPEAMCRFYLKSCYVKNQLAVKDSLTLNGYPIDLGSIKQPLYAVGAMKDHISPWHGTFLSCNLSGGPVRYVLSNEGHITGFVNPPTKKAKGKYWAGTADNNLTGQDVDKPPDPDKWLSEQTLQRGSWWPDWVLWLTEDNQPDVKPPSIGSEKYPVIEKAPGKYVLES